MNSIDDLDARVTAIENLLNSLVQIKDAPLAQPVISDVFYIQNDTGNYKIELQHLINSKYILQASENLNAGDIINIWSDGGVAKARKADASTNKRADAFVKVNAPIGTNVDLYFNTVNNSLSLLTAGAEYFLSETPGAVTTVPPISGAGKISQYIGRAVSASEIVFKPESPVDLI